MSISLLMAGFCAAMFALSAFMGIKLGKEDADKLYRGQEVYSASGTWAWWCNLIAVLVMIGGAVQIALAARLDVMLLGVTVLLLPVLYRTVYKRAFDARRLVRRT